MWTFYGCKNLRRVEFSEGLEKIGLGAFYRSGVERIDLPSSTRWIAAEAFLGCERLRNIRLNEGLETLGEPKYDGAYTCYGRTFEYSALESVVIPSTLEVLEELTFDECKNLTSVVFAEGSRLKDIRDSCFACTALKLFEAPPSLRKICSGAFYFCESLQRVVLNEGLEVVGIDSTEYNYGIGAFEKSGIKEIVLPGTLVKLDGSTFVKCDCLERVWVEQHCQIRVASCVRSKVDVQIFQAGDGNPLDNILNSAEKDE